MKKEKKKKRLADGLVFFLNLLNGVNKKKKKILRETAFLMVSKKTMTDWAMGDPRSCLCCRDPSNLLPGALSDSLTIRLKKLDT